MLISRTMILRWNCANLCFNFDQISVSIAGSVVCISPPCDNVAVILRHAERDISVTQQVDADATFLFAGLLPGRYKVWFPLCW